MNPGAFKYKALKTIKAMRPGRRHVVGLGRMDIPQLVAKLKELGGWEAFVREHPVYENVVEEAREIEREQTRPKGPTARVVDDVQIIEDEVAEKAWLLNCGAANDYFEGAEYRQWVEDGRPLPKLVAFEMAYDPEYD